MMLLCPSDVCVNEAMFKNQEALPIQTCHRFLQLNALIPALQSATFC